MRQCNTQIQIQIQIQINIQMQIKMHINICKYKRQTELDTREMRMVRKREIFSWMRREEEMIESIY